MPFIPGPPNYANASDEVLIPWIQLYFPNLSVHNISTVLAAYDPAEYSELANSGFERLLALYSDVIYNCPSYWWAEAYGENAW